MAIPTDIAGLVAWYKADAITGVSDGVQFEAWPDSSGGGNTTEQPFDFKPTFETNEIGSLPVVSFGATADTSLRSNAAISTTITKTIFAVIRPSSVGATADGVSRTVWGGDNGSVRIRCFEGKLDFIRVGSAILATSNTSLVAGTVYVVTITLSSTAATIYLSGVQDATASHSQTLTASTVMYMGGSGLFGGERYSGAIAELFWYDATLSSTNRDDLVTYLTGRWAVPAAIYDPPTALPPNIAVTPASVAQPLIASAPADRRKD